MKRIKEGSTLILVNKETQDETQVIVTENQGNNWIKVKDPDGLERVINILDYVIIILTYADRIWNIIKSWFK